MSSGNWKYILSVFSFQNSISNGIFVIKHTLRDPLSEQQLQLLNFFFFFSIGFGEWFSSSSSSSSLSFHTGLLLLFFSLSRWAWFGLLHLLLFFPFHIQFLGLVTIFFFPFLFIGFFFFPRSLLIVVGTVGCCFYFMVLMVGVWVLRVVYLQQRWSEFEVWGWCSLDFQWWWLVGWFSGMCSCFDLGMVCDYFDLFQFGYRYVVIQIWVWWCGCFDLFRWVWGEGWMVDEFVVLGLWLGVFVDCDRGFARHGFGFCLLWVWVLLTVVGIVGCCIWIGASLSASYIYIYIYFFFFLALMADCGFLWVASGGVRCV